MVERSNSGTGTSCVRRAGEYAPGMPSAALSLNWPRLIRSTSRWAAPAACAWLAACSVYSDDLVDDSTAGITGDRGGTDAGPGLGGGAGKDQLPAAGGTDSVVPSDGGEPAVPAPGGSGSQLGGAPTGTAGTLPATGGSAGSTSQGGTGGVESGSGGSGGMPVGDLIDGFEDEDLTLEQTGGRGGVWYLFDDLTVGKVGPTPLGCSPLSEAPALLGVYAMHITASGFTGWGSGLGVDFRAGKKAYDASKYSGVRFWAKVGVGKNTRHRVQLADATTDKAGGKCNPAPAAPEGEKCDDHFGVNATFTTTWAQYVIPFEELSQIGWGNAAEALDKSSLYGLQVTAKAKLEVDLWLDQIEFF